MRGTLLITGKDNHYGKLIFKDGSGSPIMKFPKSYESKDIVEIIFVGNDPSKGIISMSATSPTTYYGTRFVSDDFRPDGIILSN